MRFRPARPLAATSLLAATVTVVGGLVLVAAPAVAADPPTCSVTQANVDAGPPAFSVTGVAADLLGAKGTLTLTRHDKADDKQTVDVTAGSGSTTATGTIADPTKVNPGTYDGTFSVVGQTPLVGATTTGTCSVVLTSNGPTITSTDLPSIPQGSAKAITFTGTRFHPGTAPSGEAGFTLAATNVTSTTLASSIAVDPTVTVGSHTLTLTGTDGKTATTSINVTAGPKVTTFSPSSVHRGTATTVTFLGTGLANATFTIGDSTVGTASITSSNATTLVVSITYAAATTPGDHGFLIGAPDGGQYAGKILVTGELPTAPQNVKVTPGTNSLTIAFAPPALTGGSPILDYTATIQSAAGTSTQTASASPLHVTGLVAGTAYAVTVVARNVTGTGPASAVVKTKTKGTAPSIALTLSKTTVTSGQTITLKGVLPAGQFAAGDLIIITSKVSGEKTAGFIASPSAPASGKFALNVTPYYNTCYSVSAGSYTSTVCAHVITVTKSIAVVRNGSKLTITAQVGPGRHITKASQYRIALREVDSHGKVLRTLATVKPSDYRQAKGFGRVGANLVKFVITAPPAGTRLIIIPIKDLRSTPKASNVFIV